MLFVLNFLIIYINYAQTIDNPIILNDKQYPFVIPNSNDNYDYVITSGESLKINKESGNIEKKNTNFFSHEPLYCYDNSNNNYIYESNNLYYITNNPFINISSIVQNKNPDSLKGNYTGCIPQDNDFIMYGYDSHDIIFLSKS